MDWLEELQKLNDKCPATWFQRNHVDYNLVVYTFLALAKGLAKDYEGAALQLKRAVHHIEKNNTNNKFANDVLDFVDRFKKHYKSEYDKIWGVKADVSRDFYLNTENVYNRLSDEYKQYGRLIIGCDFDDTLYDFHKKGRSYNDIIELLRRWRNHAEIIITSCIDRDDVTRIKFIQEYLCTNDIPYDKINQQSCNSPTPQANKIYYNVLLDDRAGLRESYDVLIRLITEIENGGGLEVFDAKRVKLELVEWIREWFKNNGTEKTKAVIGISGGKDSSVVAALCVEALGKDRVIGVLMPEGEQYDIQYSYDLVNHLGIKHYVVNIGTTVKTLMAEIEKVSDFDISEQTKINAPARVRMTTLYAVSQSNNGRVIGTGNLSENHVGFFTRFGDGASDCEPIGNLTVTEVREVGREIGLPKHLIEKVPTDGLCGMSDEERFGFTYDVLDTYLRMGVCEDAVVRAKIDQMHAANKFKFRPMPMYEVSVGNF